VSKRGNGKKEKRENDSRLVDSQANNPIMKAAQGETKMMLETIKIVVTSNGKQFAREFEVQTDGSAQSINEWAEFIVAQGWSKYAVDSYYWVYS
jgi:hypothetical protein